ncbi:MAG TPA: hypothetical protein VMV00_01315 [Candidatus Baltobacteraceae bacterium]|nr:hypothetical protein [Candidatus Baltobacteraceae bacterium]
MDIVGAFKEAVHGALHPRENTAKRSVRESLLLYYNAAIIPLIIAIAIGVVGYFAVGNAIAATTTPGFAFYRIFASLGVVGIAVALPALEMLVFMPLSILIGSAIYQLFAKRLLKMWPGDYSNTVAATTFGAMPGVLLFGLTEIGVLSTSYSFFIIATAVVALWSIIVTVVSISAQHKISVGKAFGGWLVSIVLLWIIAVVITVVAVTLAFSLGVFNVGQTTGGSSGYLQGSECIAAPGYVCNAANLSTLGTLSFNFMQNTGTTLYGAVLSVAPQNATLDVNGFPMDPTTYQIGTLASGSAISVRMPATYPPLPQVCSTCSAPVSPGTPLLGYIWLNYSGTQGGPSNIANKVATISVKAS